VNPGETLTRWTVRIALACYTVAMACWWRRRDRLAGLAWTTGCLGYLAHVAAAFHFYHGWSHQAAWQETARRTADLMGWSWGGGLYWNYAFTLVWVADAVWWWRDAARYHQRRRWVTAVVHAFLGFMIFQGAVVFASGAVRWLGLIATLAAGLKTFHAAGARQKSGGVGGPPQLSSRA